MLCPRCRKPVEIPGQPCPACGAGGIGPTPESPGVAPGVERELLRLGPFGVSIARKRPGVFVPVMKNCTEVVATEARLLGLRKPGCVFALFSSGGGTPAFEVPYRAVELMERADFLGNRAVWIRYRDGEQVREVAVIAALTCHAGLEHLWQILQQQVPARKS